MFVWVVEVVSPEIAYGGGELRSLFGVYRSFEALDKAFDLPKNAIWPFPGSTVEVMFNEGGDDGYVITLMEVEG